MKSFKTKHAVKLFFAVLFLNATLMAQDGRNFPLVGHWPYGGCRGVDVVENIAYIGNGPVLQTYDVTDKLNPAFLGEVMLPALIDQIVIHNNLAFVAIDGSDREQDMQIVDISEPGNPIMLGLIDRQFSMIKSILPSNNYIILMMSGYLEFIDVSDPANPIEIEKNFDLDSGLEEGKLRDNLFYAANTQIGLQVYEVSDPANIVKIGELVLGDTTEVDPYSIEIRDNYAFLGFDGTGLAIVDISDPAKPVKVATISPPRDYSYNSHIELYGNHLYLADASSGEIYIYDISDVENPRELHKTEGLAQIGSMKIREGFLYVARVNDYRGYFTGLQILSIKDPVNPTQASFIAAPEALAGLKIFEEKNEAYFGGYNVLVLDITDKNNPKTKTVIQTRAHIGNFTFVDNYMFAAMGYDGFGIYDIADPEAPQQVGYFDVSQFGSGQFIGEAVDVFIKDSYAFVAIRYAGLIVLDISDKTNPQLVARLSEFGAFGMHRDGDYLYVSKFVSGKYIVDISDPRNPTILENHEIFDGLVGGLFTRDNYAYLAGSTFYVFDVSEKSNPIEISSTDTGNRGSISIFDNKVYIASSDKDSVFIYDVTDPYNLVSIDSINLTIDGSVEFTEDYIYTAARYEGLKIYKKEIVPTSVKTREPVPSSFSLAQNYPNPFNPGTTISYSIPKSEFVELKIFNQLGKEIATLVQQHQSAGDYRVNFKATNLPSGLYFYRLKIGRQTEWKKMTLIK